MSSKTMFDIIQMVWADTCLIVNLLIWSLIITTVLS